MAENSSHPGWGADMDAQEHVRTYRGFITGSTWGIVILTVILVLMAWSLV